MKKTLIILGAILFSVQASAFVVKKKKESKNGKKQTVIVACEDLKGHETKEVFKIVRKMKKTKLKKWKVTGQKGKYKKYEDAAEKICNEKDLK